MRLLTYLFLLLLIVACNTTSTDSTEENNTKDSSLGKTTDITKSTKPITKQLLSFEDFLAKFKTIEIPYILSSSDEEGFELKDKGWINEDLNEKIVQQFKLFDSPDMGFSLSEEYGGAYYNYGVKFLLENGNWLISYYAEYSEEGEQADFLLYSVFDSSGQQINSGTLIELAFNERFNTIEINSIFEILFNSKMFSNDAIHYEIQTKAIIKDNSIQNYSKEFKEW